MQAATSRDPILRWIAVLAPLACLLGGCVFWLRRVGLLDRERYYDAYLAADEASDLARDTALFDATIAEVHRVAASLHELDSAVWLLTKGWKELVWLLILAGVVVHIRRFQFAALPARPAFSLLGLLTGWAVIRAALFESVSALATGLRASGWWVLAALAPREWPEQLLRRLSRAFVWVLFIQTLLIPWEMNFGLYMYWMHVGDVLFARPVGTFSLPASLAAFSVLAWSMALTWGQYSVRERIGLSALTLLVIYVNASGIGWAAYFGSVAAVCYLRLGARRRWIVLACAGASAIAGWIALPDLTGRYDLHDSVWGRVLPVTEYARKHVPTFELLTGHRFDAGSNTFVASPSETPETSGLGDRPVGDSLPASLLWKIGVLGMLASYGLMALALLRRPDTAQVGVVLVLCSLTINIAEHFPLNLVLGLWLADALRRHTTA